MKICIDPGHGGFDSGAVGPGGMREKNANLKLGLLLGAGIIGYGYEVVFTRQEDSIKQKTVTENLKNIVKTANGNKCDFLISIHQNSSTNPMASGTEVFCNLENPVGVRLAKSILKYTVGMTGRADRGVKDGTGLYVIKHSRMTSVLIETLFVSNPEEEKMLMDNKWMMKYAAGLAKAIDVVLKKGI